MNIIRDYKYIIIDGGGVDIAIIPPPPSEAEKWFGLGLAIAKWGYKATILNLPTCRKRTIERIVSITRGAAARVYLRYSHEVAYAGFGALLDPAPFDESSVAREARSNIRYALPWEGCLNLRRDEGEVEVVGGIPEGLRLLRAWLTNRAGGGELVD